MEEEKPIDDCLEDYDFEEYTKCRKCQQKAVLDGICLACYEEQEEE